MLMTTEDLNKIKQICEIEDLYILVPEYDKFSYERVGIHNDSRNISDDILLLIKEYENVVR